MPPANNVQQIDDTGGPQESPRCILYHVNF